jgi:hypothetical protein
MRLVPLFLLLFPLALAAGEPDARAEAKAEAQAEGSDREFTVPTMSQETAAILANAFASKQENLALYQVDRVVYEAEPGSHLWTLRYDLKHPESEPASDQGWFVVVVDDRNGVARFGERAAGTDKTEASEPAKEQQS